LGGGPVRGHQLSVSTPPGALRGVAYRLLGYTAQDLGRGRVRRQLSGERAQPLACCCVDPDRDLGVPDDRHTFVGYLNNAIVVGWAVVVSCGERRSGEDCDGRARSCGDGCDAGRHSVPADLLVGAHLFSFADGEAAGRLSLLLLFVSVPADLCGEGIEDGMSLVQRRTTDFASACVGVTATRGRIGHVTVGRLG
jgi:hypothetical protein